MSGQLRFVCVQNDAVKVSLFEIKMSSQLLLLAAKMMRLKSVLIEAKMCGEIRFVWVQNERWNPVCLRPLCKKLRIKNCLFYQFFLLTWRSKASQYGLFLRDFDKVFLPRVFFFEAIQETTRHKFSNCESSIFRYYQLSHDQNCLTTFKDWF